MGGFVINLWLKFIGKIDNCNIKIKLQILFVVCVLLPLILTDSIIIGIIAHSEKISMQHDMENTASAVSYTLTNKVDNIAARCSSLNSNKIIERFLDKEYESAYDYVKSYQLFSKSFLQGGYGDNTLARIYVKNDTILNGGLFADMDSIKDTKWYKYYQESALDTVFYYYYEDEKATPDSQRNRKFAVIHKLNYYTTGKEKIIKLELDYNGLLNNLEKMQYSMPVYICHNDTVLVSNTFHNSMGVDFFPFVHSSEVGYVKKVTLYGMDLQIKVLKPERRIFTAIRNHLLPILFLLFCNIILPFILMKAINESFVKRLEELSCVFNRNDDEHLINIDDARGKDEIGSLMRNYNKMAARTNQLIQTVYKNKLKEQENNIAKQKAELLALHSQINPHFLFNALESIRMHSVLKEEFETADMVEKLASMMRQNVEWSNDFVEIKKEMGFVSAYLGLQRYRFGERLSFEIDIEEECNNYLIPKLSLVTFVENACVHGVERKKGPSWIFVRAFLKEEELYLEIEDTGCGMNDEYTKELKDRMEAASIEMLEEKGRVGIINACLRLKMATKNEVHFDIESEEGVGTLIQIKIPVSHVVQ